MDNVVFFNPYIGDTFVASALCRKITEKDNTKTWLASLGDEFLEFGKLFDVALFSSPSIKEFLYQGSTFNGCRLDTEYNGSISHVYSPSHTYYEYIHKLVVEICDSLQDKGTFYIFHYSYPMCYLGKIAKQRGHKVYGYIVNNKQEIEMITYDNKVVKSIIWTDEFIGTRLAKIFIGSELSKKDFICLEFTGEQSDENKVTLFPTTRGNKLFNVGNWNIDVQYLRNNGFKTMVSWYGKESYEDFSVTNIADDCRTFFSTKTMIEYLSSSLFIICNDSFSFHLAWYYNIPAIVKLKSGINHEWIPEWVRKDSRYQFIEPIMMFKDEYIYLLNRAVKNIKEVLGVD